MAKTGVPIKVIIGLRPNGHADHPDWTQLPLAVGGKDQIEKEALVRDQQIVKWVYDKTSGHAEETPDSPVGQQLGMMIVTEEYANQAVATFPGLVTIMSEVEAEDFWDNKGFAHVPEESIDTVRLQGLKAQRDLMVDLQKDVLELGALDAKIAKALDPDDSEPGVNRMKDKRWTDAKVYRGFDVQ